MSWRRRWSASRRSTWGWSARFETLEDRRLLSISPGPVAPPPLVSTAEAVSTQPATTATALPMPTISLPESGGFMGGDDGIGISNIWVADPGSDQMTATFSVEHGTFFLVASPGMQISGNDTSTLVLTGTEQQIYSALNPNPVEPHAVAFSNGSGLAYTPDAGFTGTDVLTVSAYGTAAGAAQSPTATSQLLLSVPPRPPGRCSTARRSITSPTIPTLQEGSFLRLRITMRCGSPIPASGWERSNWISAIPTAICNSAAPPA